MNAEDRERQAERWLDAALRHYSDVQPRPGLEQRILANLEARQRERRRWSRWTWIPAAAMLILSAALLWNTRRPTQTPQLIVIRPAQKTEPAGLNPPITRTLPPRVHARHRALGYVQHAISRPLGPKQEIFPSLEPLSEQERLALSFVRNAPAEALGLAQAQQAERERARALEKQSNRTQQ